MRAHEPASFFWGRGERDSRRHSTTSFKENVVVTKTSYLMLEAKFYYFGPKRA